MYYDEDYEKEKKRLDMMDKINEIKKNKNFKKFNELQNYLVNNGYKVDIYDDSFMDTTHDYQTKTKPKDPVIKDVMPDEIDYAILLEMAKSTDKMTITNLNVASVYHSIPRTNVNVATEFYFNCGAQLIEERYLDDNYHATVMQLGDYLFAVIKLNDKVIKLLEFTV